MGGIEFYTVPDGRVCYTADGVQSFVFTPEHVHITELVIETMERYYPEAVIRLRKIYKGSRANRQFYLYRIAHRFIRCNFGEYDTLHHDLTDCKTFNLEQVKCPLRGECPEEGCICNPSFHSPFSPREEEVVKCLAEGYSRGETAERLCISVNTVNRHIDNIKTRLQLRHTYNIISLYSSMPVLRT